MIDRTNRVDGKLIDLNCEAIDRDAALRRFERQAQQWFGDDWNRHMPYEVRIVGVMNIGVETEGEPAYVFHVQGIAGRKDYVEAVLKVEAAFSD